MIEIKVNIYDDEKRVACTTYGAPKSLVQIGLKTNVKILKMH